jgi:hypothetical protein
MPDLTTQALVCQLLRYAHANPHASDSAEGIARWWLDPKEGVDVQVLREALEMLVRQGIFEERVATDGRRSYRRSCPDAELRKLLGELACGPYAGN